MLDNNLLQQLTDIFSPLAGKYILRATVDKPDPQRDSLTELVKEMASTSGHITAETTNGNGLKLELLKNGKKTNISFRAVPGGHEFSSLILAIMNADEKGKNLPDEQTTARIRSLNGPIHLTTYMSLSCTNCPDVVQALNVMAFLNPEVFHEAVDGGLYQDEIKTLDIQAVPTVIADGETIHIGRGSLGVLLDKLEKQYGHKK